jgi:uncharacterized protein YecE (DUF72 family)
MEAGIIRLGTSAFTAAGWPGSFYPAGLKPSDYLSYYAQHFNIVEVDSTFYHSPSLTTTRGWYARTPSDFRFTLKVPQIITKEKVLVDCAFELEQFFAAIEPLGEKLGALFFQFGYFNKSAFKSVGEFIARLEPFLKALPSGFRFALEIRNKSWLVPKFAELLREHKIALALIDQAWMPPPEAWFEKIDPFTADFTYIRWLGDRKGIERLTKSWDKTIYDVGPRLREWVGVVNKAVQRKIQVMAFANNHFAGHGPATVRVFQELWSQRESSA